mmetsp:Transcript_35729/g.91206  ORF Transcript_35729/g.91206 Transcript_35729/m.91206 type:complete len:454 (-) Transcript_35729:87-1448(-)
MGGRGGRLLLGALHPLAAGAALIVAVAVVGGACLPLPRPPLELLLDVHHLGGVLLCVLQLRRAGAAHRGQHRRQLLAHGCVQLVRKLDVKPHIQIALEEGLRVVRHALLLDAHPVVLLHHLAGLVLDHQLAPIQLRKHDLAAAQRVHQRQLVREEQVVADALEGVVLFLVQLEHHVAWLLAGVVAHAGLAPEHDALPIFHALLDVDLKHVLLALQPLGAAVAALVTGRHVAARAVALAARLLDLLHHARAEGAQQDLAAAAAALRAGGGGAGLGAAAGARGALDVAGQAELAGATVVHLLQGHLEAVLDIVCLALTRAATTAAKHVKDVGHTAAAATAAVSHALLDGVLAVLVVYLPLLRILEHVVHLVDVAEGLSIAALVRVVLHSRFAVGLLQVGSARVAVDTQYLVVLGVIALLALWHLGHAPEAGHATEGEASSKHVAGSRVDTPRTPA